MQIASFTRIINLNQDGNAFHTVGSADSMTRTTTIDIRKTKSGYDKRQLLSLPESELADFIARLRFGNSDRANYNSPKFSYGCLARATKIPKHRLQWLIDRYIFKKDERVRKPSLSAKDAAILTSKACLQQDAAKSLERRVAAFNKSRGQVTLTRYKLRKLFLGNKIKLKRIHRKSSNPQRYGDAQVIKLAHVVQQKVVALDSASHELWVCDETLFKLDDKIRQAWSRQHENVQIALTPAQRTTVAVVGGVSARTGRMVAHLLPNQKMNQYRFVEYLQLLAGHCKGQKLAVVIDNASYHISQHVYREIERQKMPVELVRMVPYSPDFMGIELVWGLLKRRLRRELCEQEELARGQTFIELLQSKLSDLDQNENKHCIQSGFKQLFRKHGVAQELKDEFDMVLTFNGIQLTN